MAAGRTALTNEALDRAVLDALRAVGEAVNEEQLRDAACDVFPRQVNLVMVREALVRLQLAANARQIARGVWQAIVAPIEPVPLPVAAEAPVVSSVTSISVLTPSTDRKVDAEQLRVINADIRERLLVEAGPGYGKTDVICARVAKLLEDGTNANELLLLSFTRTAVREMRNRIRALASSGIETRSVEIRTVDSWIASLRSAFVTTSKAESFTASIEDVVRLLRGKHASSAEEELLRYRHVFIDEAQDLVGVRAAVAVEVLKLLSAQTDNGWTIFADPAQALYDWAEEGAKTPSSAFLDELRNAKLSFEKVELRTLHRTASSELKVLLEKSRRIVLDTNAKDPATALRSLLLAGKEQFEPKELPERVRKMGDRARDTLMLFRTSVEAMEASSYLLNDGIPHRLRFGGLPQTVAPWIAMVLAALGRAEFDRGEFEQALLPFETHPAFSGWNRDSAWRALRRIGAEGSSRVRCSSVAANIASGRRLEELSVREVGNGGLILGTVHGSKGREADFVEASLSEDSRPEDDSAAEGRVLYVAASRAKRVLTLVRSRPWKWGYEQGRAWSRFKFGFGFQTQFGFADDVDPLRSLSFAGEDPGEIQSRLARSVGQITKCLAHFRLVSSERLWPIRHVDDEGIIGSLSTATVREIRQIAKPHYASAIQHLYQVDTTSVAMRADRFAEVKESLPEPWRTTGVWLAPVVVGLSSVSAKKGTK